MRLHPRDLRSQTLVLLDREGGDVARVADEAWIPFAEALARGFDREDAAQRGETDPWSPEFPVDPDWQTARRHCALQGLKEAFERLMENGRTE
ncbi:MAG: hypothetical protein D6773_07850 [Alphaproteobacteria bacterium]|nr:MAG: hypothetical protein D6773_07850 [Alphaproteobacteria bacterium]